MPKSEIKNTFTGGRMNKDLDEILITTGEYRDAMNVQVTTSDGSDVGSLHNVMGNYQVSSIANSTLATCIGSVTDEKVDKLYWMIEGLTNNIQLIGGQWPNEYYKADAIAEYDHNTGAVNPVVVDVYECRIAFQGGFSANNIFTVNSTSELWDANAGVMRRRVWPGMILTITDSNNSTYPQLTVESVNYTNREITFAESLSTTQVFTANTFLSTLTFTSPQRALNFNTSHLITGINIIDKQLFWTDDNSEPKRIHIDRYRGTPPGSGGAITGSWAEHSYTPTRDWTQPQPHYINTHPLLEEHITVIRQNPITAPQLIMDNSSATGITEAEIGDDYWTDPSGTVPENSIRNYDRGDLSWIRFVGPEPDFKRGNILSLTTTSGNTTKRMKVSVGDPNSNSWRWWNNTVGPPGASAYACGGAQFQPCVAYKVEMIHADSDVGPTDIGWHAELEQETPMFEFKFPRFSTRYKYEDGEYSAFGPFSEVAFLPDRPGGVDFDFVAWKGYNIGMTNQIRRLALKDFIPEKDLLPDDVIEIDILHKESNSPNVYSILTIKPDEEAWQTRVTYTGDRTNTAVYPYEFSGAKGYLQIESEMVHGILPENQLLRPWDNVPRKAKAQEVSGNRLIYGNYLQNYDLLDSSNKLITPLLTIGTKVLNVSIDNEDLSPEQVYPTDSYKYSPSKSIKSLRTYQLGISYIDKYGRQTPVLTDNNEKNASLYLNEWYSDKQVKITGQVDSSPPEWAEYYKFFIKETSSEYYNLALDRWYDAEDGNVWLSFPSSERNKLDIDTYLILKKEHDLNVPVLEPARYDILAIENEAPDFIKTERIGIGKCQDESTVSQANNGSTGVTFGPNVGAGFPIESQKFVRISDEFFDGNIVFEDDATRSDCFIRFKFGNTATRWYEITNAFLVEDSSLDDEWLLDLREPLGEDVNILTNDPDDAWNEKKSPITAEFRQDRITNKPEFDGRFFVKIHSDGIIRDRIIGARADTIEYAIAATSLVQYINQDTDAGGGQVEHQGPWYGWGVPSETYYGHNVEEEGIPKINFFGNEIAHSHFAGTLNANFGSWQSSFCEHNGVHSNSPAHNIGGGNT